MFLNLFLDFVIDLFVRTSYLFTDDWNTDFVIPIIDNIHAYMEIIRTLYTALAITDYIAATPAAAAAARASRSAAFSMTSVPAVIALTLLKVAKYTAYDVAGNVALAFSP